MKYLWLLAASFKRHRLRTLLTIASIAVAFVLFGYLVAIAKAFEMGVDVADADRLVVRHKVTIVQLLPQKYEGEIESIDGVLDATHATWFGGIYQDPKNFFGQFPVEPEEYLEMYPEFVLPDDQKAAWLATRTGAVAGRAIAEKYGWKIGDKVPIQATIWPAKDGGTTWAFDLVGIYDGAEKGTDDTQFLFRYDFFDENRQYGEGLVGWYYVRTENADVAASVAEAIDAQFANSPTETKTETEGAFVQAFADQVGNIGAIITAILTAVFFTILLVAGNTMAQAVRERTQELGVLKAIGYSDRLVLFLVLAEALLIAGVGGGLGLGLAWMSIAGGDPTGGALPLFYFPPGDVVLGIALVIALGLATGLLPALGAMRLHPAEALRRQ